MQNNARGDLLENPPAFPVVEQRAFDGTGIREGSEGMTLLDYFAGQALAGMQASHAGVSYKRDAERAYCFAAAMLSERHRTTAQPDSRALQESSHDRA